MNSSEPKKLYHFYGSCITQGLFFIQKGTGIHQNIISFGCNYYGELANGESYKTMNKDKYPTPKIAKNVPEIGKVSKIAQGHYHTLFLMSPSNDVYGVGCTDNGVLSVNKEGEVLSPILISSKSLKGVRIGDISCGGAFARRGFSVLLSKKGVPYSCGYNVEGQCGVGTYENIYSAIPMKSKEKFIQVDCGEAFTVLLTNKRDIYKTGKIYGEKLEKIPIKLHLNEKVKFFRAGAYHLLVVGKSGQLFGMGYNEYDQLTSKISNDGIIGVQVLTKITSLKGKIKDIKCTHIDSYALMENKDLYGWGGNFFGQSKGDGTVSINPLPFKMKSNVEQIEVGTKSCYVFCKEGVYVCGRNDYGELGMGNLDNFYDTLTLNKNLKNIEIVENFGIIPKFDTKKQIFDVIIFTN